MKNITADEIIQEVKKQKAFEQTSYTYSEFVRDLTKLQYVIAQYVFDYSGSEDECPRVNDCKSEMGKLAREKGLYHDSRVQKCFRSLEAVNKQISISMAGLKGEQRVEKELSRTGRPEIKMYKNVYVTDGQKETELDNIVLTKNGIIILEIKNTKQDITLSEDGRILMNNETSYHNESMGDKMQDKRDCLIYMIRHAAEEKGYDIPIRIRSYIVFSAPQNCNIHITDNFHQERYCKNTQLKYLVRDYTSDIEYSDDEMRELNEIITDFETNRKGITSSIDFMQVLKDLGDALEVLTAPEQNEMVIGDESQPTSEIKAKDEAPVDNRRRMFTFALRTAAVVASAVWVMVAQKLK